MAERGSLSINSENMFPIIKKWLYSDHDIFLRELVSNGCDAITKLKKLDVIGDYELPEDYKARIDIIVDPAEKTIQVRDNGLGMTGDEVKEYINNIATISLFPARRHSWRNTRTRRLETRSSDISVWDFIPPSWSLIK